MDYRKYIAEKLGDLNLPIEEIASNIVVPPDKEMGDYALPCFKFAKVMRKSPVMIAEELKNKFVTDNVVSEVSAVNGYLNFKVNRLVKASYKLLGLISFLTAGEPETRAWTIKEGTKAPQAAGKIHSDFEKGFIRAECIDWQLLLECGNYTKAKELGKVRSEGKDYVMKDGDVVLFRFNV